MMWNELHRFEDTAAPKLYRLREAAERGLRIPRTVWVSAEEALQHSLARPFPGAVVCRSASPFEDTEESTAAGQFLSCEVSAEGSDADFCKACRDVARSLDGKGAVFVQERVDAIEAGVAFFDGQNYEIARAAGSNVGLTDGSERGEVQRGVRGSGEPALVKKLARVKESFPAMQVIDVEWAIDAEGFVLLQVRPAPFEVKRNRRLSLANHKEILGDPPSPWMVSTLEISGEDALAFFARIDPAVSEWREPYAVRMAGRAFLNVSVFERLMDRWGLPRALVYEGVGGGTEIAAADRRIGWGRFLRSVPRLVRLQIANLLTIARSDRVLENYDREVLEPACAVGSLSSLFDAGVRGLGIALNTNFAINGALSGVGKVRNFLGVRGAGRVLTLEMMEQWDDVRALPREERELAFEAWLAAWGHRGPLESDLSRPRFGELREVLRADLEATPASEISSPRASKKAGAGLFFALDRRRERFRDELMKRWQVLRAAILNAARAVPFEKHSDVFFLERNDVRRPVEDLPDLARARREEHARDSKLRIENDALITEDEVRELLRMERSAETARGEDQTVFTGIALSSERFRGRAVMANDLLELLEKAAEGDVVLDSETVLVVPTLEPSWAVVFGRVGAVVAEMGGELSHASILLREAGKPAIVNCAGIFRALADGDELELDGATEQVVIKPS